MSSQIPRHQIIASPLGDLVASWTELGLYSLEFRRPDAVLNLSISTLDASDTLEDCIAQFFQTGRMEWDLKLLDWSAVSDFHRRALETCFAIPCGETKTYGTLAESLGSPRAARAVGGAMAKNRWPILIPCHRVLGTSGKLTGYSGVGGIDTKRKLLEMEQAWAGNLLFS